MDQQGRFTGMTDEQVLACAKESLRRVSTAPIGSVARARQWQRYEDAKAELDHRFLQHVLRKLGELPADGM